MNGNINEVKIETQNEKWIGIDEAAEHLGIKPVTVRDWIKKNKGKEHNYG